GVEIDRDASTIAIRAVWPGEYRLVVRDETSDAFASCEVCEGAETMLDLELPLATRVIVRVRLTRPFRPGERWSAFLHSPTGVTEIEAAYERSPVNPDGLILLNAGIPLDTERIEVRTSLGQSGEYRLSEPLVPGSTIDIELR